MSIQLYTHDFVWILLVFVALLFWIRDQGATLDKMYDKCDAQDEALWVLFEHFDRPGISDGDKKVLAFCRKTLAGYGEDADS